MLYRSIAPLLLLVAFSVAGCDSTSVTGGGLAVTYIVEGGAASVSFTDVNGAGQSAVSGRWEHQFTADPGMSLVLSAVSADSNPVTGTILVDGNLFKTGRGRTVHLEGSSSSSSSGEIEVRGFIEARSSNSVVVLGRTFIIDSQTTLLGRNNETVSLDAFQLGDFVEAEGRPQSDGTIRATKLKFEDGDDGGQIEVGGLIEARTASSVTVQGLVFVINSQTRFLDDDNNPVSFDAFQVGVLVEAEGFERPDGTYSAEKLKLDDH